MPLQCFYKLEIQHFLLKLGGFHRVGTYALRICVVLGVIAASLLLDLLWSAFAWSYLAPQQLKYSSTLSLQPGGSAALSSFSSRFLSLDQVNQSHTEWRRLAEKWFSKYSSCLQMAKEALPGSSQKMWDTMQQQLSQTGPWKAGGLIIRAGMGCSHGNCHGYLRPRLKDGWKGGWINLSESQAVGDHWEKGKFDWLKA